MFGVRALAAEEARLRAAVALLAAVEAGPTSPLTPRLAGVCAGAILRYAALAPLPWRETTRAEVTRAGVTRAGVTRAGARDRRDARKGA